MLHRQRWFGALDILTNYGKVLETVSFYTIRQYSDNVFRIIRYQSVPLRGFSHGVKGSERTNEEKLEESRLRAQRTIVEIALCNHWDYFVTLTVSPDHFNRYELLPIWSKLSQWFRDQRKQLGYENLSYMLVPERHEDGAWHFHGFMSGIPDHALSLFVSGIHPQRLCNGVYLNWRDLSVKFGYCSLDPVRDQVCSAFYCSKYFTKDRFRNVTEIGSHMYYVSRGLLRAQTVGYCYESKLLFDNSIEHKSVFCDVGWLLDVDCLSVISELDDICYIALDPSVSKVVVVEPDFEQMSIDGFPLSTFYSPYSAG